MRLARNRSQLGHAPEIAYQSWCDTCVVSNTVLAEHTATAIFNKIADSREQRTCTCTSQAEQSITLSPCWHAVCQLPNQPYKSS